MFNKKKKLQEEINSLRQELSKRQSYDKVKIQDDFSVLNEILAQKERHYTNLMFTFNRFSEENNKKIIVKDEEINETSNNIIKDVFVSLSDDYVSYLVNKYFSSLDKMIEIYTERVYYNLFTISTEYNTKNITPVSGFGKVLETQPNKKRGN